MTDERGRAERSFRGISQRLATHYLTNLGGDEVEHGHVEGDGWQVELSEEKVSIGPTVKLNQVTVVFEGDPEAVDAIVDRFAQKAMRAGG